MEKMTKEFLDVKRTYEKILKYGHNEYQEMKDEMGWANVDVAKIVGYKHMSVKNQTRKSNPLPIWAQMLVFVWRVEYKRYKYFPVDDEVEKFQALLTKYKTEFDGLISENALLTSQNEGYKVRLRKEERMNKKLLTLVKKLEDIENESEVEISDTATQMKRDINSVNSKHRRKMKVLEDIKLILPEPPKRVAKAPAKRKAATPKGNAKGVNKGSASGTTNNKKTSGTRKKKTKAEASAK